SAQLKAPPAELINKVGQLLKKPDAKKSGTGSAISKIDADGESTTLPDGLPFMAVRVDGSTEDLSAEAIRVATEIGGVAVLAGETQGKASLVVAVAKDKS